MKNTKNQPTRNDTTRHCLLCHVGFYRARSVVSTAVLLNMCEKISDGDIGSRYCCCFGIFGVKLFHDLLRDIIILENTGIGIGFVLEERRCGDENDRPL